MFRRCVKGRGSLRPCAGLALAVSALSWIAAPSTAPGLSRPASGSGAQAGQRAAIGQVLDDYIRLYTAGTLERWKTLFHPALGVAFPGEEGTIQIRNLEEFFQRQKNYFATGRRISERLENVRIDEGRRMARVSADFVFMDEGEEHGGRLGLHLVQEHESWKIVAIVFAYDAER